MAHDDKKLSPVHEARETAYPSYRTYRDERRTVLRWLGAGGTAVAVGGLLGCDSVMDAFGVARPPAPLEGELVAPYPPQPHPTGVSGDDDDSAARPEIRQTKGDIVAPEPVTPEKPAGNGRGVGGKFSEAKTTGGSHTARPDVPPPGGPPLPEPTTPPDGVRPDGHLDGDMAVPEPLPEPKANEVRPESQLRGRMVMPDGDEK